MGSLSDPTLFGLLAALTPKLAEYVALIWMTTSLILIGFKLIWMSRTLGDIEEAN